MATVTMYEWKKYQKQRNESNSRRIKEMSFISEKIKELRGYARICEEISDCTSASYMDEAADIIEELSRKLHSSQMERSSQYYHDG